MIIKARKEAVSALGERLPFQIDKVIQRDSQRVDHLKTLLTSLSPLATLERGYAIVSNEQGQVVTDSSEANVGDTVSVRLHRGGLKTVISETQD
jgi:exodeoxyribonuclease VII large subunit